MRTDGSGFGSDYFGRGRRRRSAQSSGSFGLARLASLWRVRELFIPEEKLLACGENEFCTAVYAFQHLVLEFH
jgi:hypothetical protein